MCPIPHDFEDPAMLELALTHSSVDNARNNERLEFLGDAVLDLIIADELFHHHPDLPEGDLTELKAWVVSRRSLAEVARGLDLAQHARVGRGLEGRTLSRSILANLYEAVLGAVYLDAGMEAARKFSLETLALPLAEVREQKHGVNAKQAFQELCQKFDGEPPSYSLIETRGLAHSRAFLVQAEGRDRTYPSAWGRTRKEAERWAAHEALLAIEYEQEPG
ncbi:MAG: ribonuclease-3 [Chlamydiales bacterium]|jgi:ribonuclease-3